MAMDFRQEIETNFAIKKFLELPLEEQKRIYDLLHAREDIKLVEAGTFLLGLVAGNSRELAQGLGLDNWVVWPKDVPKKACLMFKYFQDHLKYLGDHMEIELMPVPVAPGS